MRKTTLPILALVVGVGIGYVLPRPTPPLPPKPIAHETPAAVPSREITATHFDVLSIVDGDTFRVMYDGEPTKVRILNIDTPERGHPQYGQATEALRRLIDGRTVELRFTDSKGKRDNWGRLLAEVWLDGMDIGEAMLATGLAKRWEER